MREEFKNQNGGRGKVRAIGHDSPDHDKAPPKATPCGCFSLGVRVEFDRIEKF